MFVNYAMVKKAKQIVNYLLSKKFVRFSLSGSLATLVDVLILYILTEFFALWYLFSAVFSFIAGTLVHYSISSHWVFKCERRSFSQYLAFTLIQTIGLVIKLSVIYILVEYFSFWYILAKLIAVFVGLIWNFSANLKITFKKI